MLTADSEYAEKPEQPDDIQDHLKIRPAGDSALGFGADSAALIVVGSLGCSRSDNGGGQDQRD